MNSTIKTEIQKWKRGSECLLLPQLFELFSIRCFRIASVPPPPQRRSRERSSSVSRRMDRDREPSKPHTHTETTADKPQHPKPPSSPTPVETEPQPEADSTMPQEEEISVEQQIAARRARREAIRAKYATTAHSTPVPQSPREPTPVTAIRPMVHDLSLEDERKSQTPRNQDTESPPQTKPVSRSTSPATNGDTFSLAKDGPEAISDSKVDADGEQISAADYDPNQDRREDEERRVRDIIAKNGLHKDNAMDVVEEIVEDVEEEEDVDVDDMFAIATTKTKKKTVKVTKTVRSRRSLLTSSYAFL